MSGLDAFDQQATQLLLGRAREAFEVTREEPRTRDRYVSGTAGLGDNLLLARMTRRRLEGEAVRDALLAVSGKLDERVGGPSIFPELPPGVVPHFNGDWPVSASESDRNRRSLYVFVRRNMKYPLFDAFDVPDTNLTCPERNISVTCPFTLSNMDHHPFAVDVGHLQQ